MTVMGLYTERGPTAIMMLPGTSPSAVVVVALLVVGAVGAVAAMPAGATVTETVGDGMESLVAADDVADADDSATDDGTTGEGATGGGDGSDDANRTSPGERLAGVVGVQGAEIDGEIDSRAFARRVGPDRSDEERADAIAERLDRNADRLDEIERRQAELRDRRAAGEITEGEFRSRMARLAAETATIDRTTNRSAAAAEEIPREQLEARGVDADRIETLRTRANELSGPEVAAIAREIAGPNVGGPAGRPDHAGPPASDDPPGNASDRAGSPADERGPPGNASQGPPENASGGGSDGDRGTSGSGSDGDRGASGSGGGDGGSPGANGGGSSGNGSDGDRGSSGTGSGSDRGGSGGGSDRNGGGPPNDAGTGGNGAPER